MKYKVTIVGWIEADSYSKAVDAVDSRLVAPVRKHNGGGPAIQPVRPARIDVRLEGESE